MSINDKDPIVTPNQIMRSLVRLETIAEATQREIAELKTETRVRLNQHSVSIRSLKATRNKQLGAAKGLGVVGTIIGVVVGWFKYG